MRRLTPTAVVVAAVVVVWLLAGAARAQEDEPCEDLDRPRLALGFDPSHGDAFRGEVRAELAAALASHDVTLCPPLDGNSEGATATVRLGVPDADGRLVSIELRDAVTDKTLRREMELGALPGDTRAFALAAAIHELLRASWLELVLPDAPPPAKPVPPAVEETVRRTVTRDLERVLPTRTALLLRAAGEAYGGGELHWGGDLVVTHAPVPAFSVGVALGGRRGVSVDAPNGRVRAHTLAGELQLGWWPFRGSNVSLGALLGSQVALVRFEGRPDPGATGGSEAGAVVVPFVGLAGGVEVGALVLRLELSAGWSAVAFAATDGGERVTEASGPVGRASLGVGLRL